MKPLIFGHRGSPFEAPENTISSIKKAIAANVGAVEIDVHKTKDNVLVVIHDDKVDRTTNGRGFVKDFTLKDLKKLNINNDEKIPTLQEIIDFVKGKIKIVVEIKQKNIEKDVVSLLEKNNFIDKAYVISFYHGAVKKAKELDNRVKTGVLFNKKVADPCSRIRGANADAIVINYKYVGIGLVKKVHKENFKVFVWNIDTIEDLKNMLKLNVDGIGSNKPGLLANYFRKQQTL